jgi:hypothetical protein
MPDIQTALRSALTKTLQAWDDDEVALPPPSAQPVSTSSSPSTSSQKPAMINQHKITNNVSRETFSYIKDNPGSTRLEIVEALGHKGFAKGSVSSLIAQMRRSYMVHETNGLWYADVNEYAPIKNVNYKRKKKAKTQKKPTTGIGALLKAKLEATPVPTPMPIQDAMDAAAYAMGGIAAAPKRMATTIVRNRTPEDIIGNMTVYQARELYVHLKQMFGG